MKKILFPVSNRVHKARQRLLLEELKKSFEVVTVEVGVGGKTMDVRAVNAAMNFRSALSDVNPDLVLIRGDRFEMLPMAMITAYGEIPIVHLEGGDSSGVIDNKVRHAITQLSDLHFATNKDSLRRLINMGVDPDKAFDFGSLDVEYAKSLDPSPIKTDPYVVVAYHPIPGGESGDFIVPALKKVYEGEIVVIGSNSDYGKFEGEEYSAEDYLALIAHADCLIGNSSSLIKEASIFGTPVVNIGSRQNGRLKPHNVVSVPYNEYDITTAFEYQVKHDWYDPDLVYFKEDTSVNIAKKIYEVFGGDNS